MPGLNGFGLNTLALHAGGEPDPTHGARTQPIYLSASFVFQDCNTAASLFNMERSGHIDSRLSNPTVAALETRIAALEGGVGAIATSSGQAALHLAISTLLSSGDHIVASRALSGSSHNLLEHTLPRFGINTSFVDPRQPEAWRAAVRPNTRLFFGESLGNPGLDVLDIAKISHIAHESSVPLLVDATLTPPPLLNSFALGADLLIHSATKFLGGHGTAIGGVVVDSGRFDWTASGKFPSLSEAYEGLHGMNFTEESSTGAFLLRARHEGLHDFGACLSPMNAFQILQGIETLPLRIERHVSNTRSILNFLKQHNAIERLNSPELETHPDYALAKKILPKGCGGVLTFDLKNGRHGARKFIENLRLFSHLANVGDAKSLVIHPASTTHFRMSDQSLRDCGIGPGTVRLSIGLEQVEDLMEDLDRALSAAQKEVRA